jgi:hypothetical protein
MSETAPDRPPAQKHRHGCLTAYLIFMIIANSATGLVYLLASEPIQRAVPTMPGWTFPVLIAGAILNLVFAIALLKWKEWGFWGFAFSSVAVFFINLDAGIGLGSALFGLLGVPILYGVLHIGGAAKGWSQLE